MRSVLRTFVAAATFCVSTASAHAAAVMLDLTAFTVSGAQIGEKIGTYFAGGFGSFGTGPGPNLGITFESNNNFSTRLFCDSPCGSDNLSSVGRAIEVASGSVIIHAPLGFSGTVEFDAAVESPTATNDAGFSIQLADPINDPSDFVDHVAIDNSAENTQGCRNQGCPFVHYTVTLDPGVVGRALDFLFDAPVDPPDRTESALFIENLQFSDLTLPTDTPAGPPEAVPEPASWALLASGLGLFGMALYPPGPTRRRGTLRGRCSDSNQA